MWSQRNQGGGRRGGGNSNPRHNFRPPHTQYPPGGGPWSRNSNIHNTSAGGWNSFPPPPPSSSSAANSFSSSLNRRHHHNSNDRQPQYPPLENRATATAPSPNPTEDRNATAPAQNYARTGTGSSNYMDVPIPAKRHRPRDSSSAPIPGSGSNARLLGSVPCSSSSAPQPERREATSDAMEIQTQTERNNTNKTVNRPSLLPQSEKATQQQTQTQREGERMEVEEKEFKRPRRDPNFKITKENWISNNMQDLLMYECPFPMVDYDIVEDVRLPKDWMERKIQVAEETKQYMKQIIAKDNEIAAIAHEEYDSEDSEESVLVGCDYGTIDKTPPGFYLYVQSLPYSVLFDLGFLVMGTHQDNEKNCFCPCSHQMRKWRSNMDLCEPTGPDACGAKFKKSSPTALMDHLRKISTLKGSYMHQAAKVYLEKLYDNFWHFVTPGVSHKGLYIAGTSDYKRAESAEKKYLHRAINNYEHELQQKNALIKKQKQELEEKQELENANKELKQKIELLEKNRKELDVKEEAKILSIRDIDQRSLDTYNRQIQSAFQMQKGSILSASDQESTVKITTDHNISIQDLFDEWYEQGDNDSTFLFRTLEKLNTKTKTGQMAKKVLLTWEVDIRVPNEILGKGQKKVRKDITAVDKGGPTRAFITAFCEQLRDLCVYIPGIDDQNLKSPPNFCKVLLTIEQCQRGIILHQVTKRKQDNNSVADEFYNVKFDESDVLNQVEEEVIVVEKPKSEAKYKVKIGHEIRELKRGDFVVTDLAFSLFDENCIDYAVPHKESAFEDRYQNFKKAIGFDSQFSLDFLKDKARSYYRAIGRVMAHVLFDECDLTLSSIVMPQLLKNYLLHGISPDDGEFRYPLSELLVDVQNMEREFSVTRRQVDDTNGTNEPVDSSATPKSSDTSKTKQEAVKSEPLSFNVFSLDDELLKEQGYDRIIKGSDLISKDNVRIFILLHMIKSRNMALESIEEGLTLNGKLNLKNVLFAVPRVIVNARFFSNPEFEVEDVLRTFLYDRNKDIYKTSPYREILDLFEESSLPNALRTLHGKDKDALKKFVNFVTGSSYLPNYEMNPHFKIVIEFNDRKNMGAFPSAHTCEKIISFPSHVYDNNEERLASMLEKAINLGYKEFGMH